MNEKRSRILVVDDDEFVCSSLKWLLADEGYDVETASDGKNALTILSRESFDLVLTDLMMPEVDGLAVLHEAKRVSPNTAVIILTGYGTLDAAMAALKDGAYDFLTKPCDDGEMRYKIEGALEQKRLRERLGRLESADSRLIAAREMAVRLLADFEADAARMAEMSPDERRAAVARRRRDLEELRTALGEGEPKV
jgi:two-component system, NtrC family, response regulator AtoC